MSSVRYCTVYSVVQRTQLLYTSAVSPCRATLSLKMALHRDFRNCQIILDKHLLYKGLKIKDNDDNDKLPLQLDQQAGDQECGLGTISRR